MKNENKNFELSINLLLCRECDGQIMNSKGNDDKIFQVREKLTENKHSCEILILNREQFSIRTMSSKENFSCKCKCSFDLEKYIRNTYNC